MRAAERSRRNTQGGHDPGEAERVGAGEAGGAVRPVVPVKAEHLANCPGR